MPQRGVLAMHASANQGPDGDVAVFFGLSVPTSCPGVPGDVLQPRATWPDQAAYDAQARDLAARFRRNFASYADAAAPEVAAAGPAEG
jgi:phosphoenolpyruvate carboxykinase (ATP)